MQNACRPGVKTWHVNVLRSNRLNQTGLPTRKNKIIHRFTHQNEIVIFQPFPAVDLPCHPEPQSSADCMGKGHTSERVRIWPPRIRCSRWSHWIGQGQPARCGMKNTKTPGHQGLCLGPVRSPPYIGSGVANRQTDWWKGSVWPSHASREKASNHQCFSVSGHTARQYVYIYILYIYIYILCTHILCT